MHHENTPVRPSSTHLVFCKDLFHCQGQETFFALQYESFLDQRCSCLCLSVVILYREKLFRPRFLLIFCMAKIYSVALHQRLSLTLYG